MSSAGTLSRMSDHTPGPDGIEDDEAIRRVMNSDLPDDKKQALIRALIIERYPNGIEPRITEVIATIEDADTSGEDRARLAMYLVALRDKETKIGDMSRDMVAEIEQHLGREKTGASLTEVQEALLEALAEVKRQIRAGVARPVADFPVLGPDGRVHRAKVTIGQLVEISDEFVAQSDGRVPELTGFELVDRVLSRNPPAN